MAQESIIVPEGPNGYPDGQNRAGLVPILCCMLVGLIVVAFSHPAPRTGLWEYIVIGLLLGTIFGHTTFLGAWVAIGFGPRWQRFVLSIAWILLLTVALQLNLMRGHDSGGVFMILCYMVVQWVIVQIPLWILAGRYGAQIRRFSSVIATASPRYRQFGLRQLMIFTTVVAAALGIGRLILPLLIRQLNGQGEWLLFGFLTVVSIVMTLPLLLGALLPRFAWVAILFVVSLIVLATLIEFPLLKLLVGGGNGADLLHLVMINVVQALWILVIASLLRFAGYALRSRQHA